MKRFGTGAGLHTIRVLAGLVPAIHASLAPPQEGVDHRDKPGDDVEGQPVPPEGLGRIALRASGRVGFHAISSCSSPNGKH